MLYLADDLLDCNIHYSFHIKAIDLTNFINSQEINVKNLLSIFQVENFLERFVNTDGQEMDLIRQLLFPKSYDSVQCKCGVFQMEKNVKRPMAHEIPCNNGSVLSDAISSYYSTWHPFTGICETCSEHEDIPVERELERNPGILQNEDQNLILIKPVFPPQPFAIQKPKEGFSKQRLKGIGSNVIIDEHKYQCVACVVVDEVGDHSMILKRLGDWYMIYDAQDVLEQFYNDEPLDGVLYLYMKDEKVPHHI